MHSKGPTEGVACAEGIEREHCDITITWPYWSAGDNSPRRRKIAVRRPERSSFDLPDKSVGTTYLSKIRCVATYNLVAW